MKCWGKPLSSNTFHIFHDGRSLCMRWMFFGADQPVKNEAIEARTGDCKSCVRAFNKLISPAKSKAKKR